MVGAWIETEVDKSVMRDVPLLGGLGSTEPPSLLKAPIVEPRSKPLTTPGPHLRRLGSMFGRFLKSLRSETKAERAARRAAEKRAVEIGNRFATVSRQPLRRLRFESCCEDVSKQFSGEPRRARRKIARAWSKRR